MKLHNKICLVVLVMMLFVFNFTMAANVDFTILDNKGVKIKAGEEIEHKFEVRNIGSDTARKIEAEFSMADDEAKNMFSFGEDVKYIGYIRGSSRKEVVIKINAKNTARIGRYEVCLKLNYKDGNDYTSSSNEKFYIEVTDEKKVPRIEYKFNKESELTKGDTSRMFLDVINHGEIGIKDLKVELTNLSKDSIYIEGSSNIVYIDKLGPGDSKKIFYDVVISSDYSQSTISTNVKSKYSDVEDTKYEDTQDLFININGSSSKKVEIKNVNVSKTRVKKDEQFLLEGIVVNTGNVDIKDMDVTLEIDDNIIPITQNIFHENILKKGEEKKYSFKLKATEDASEKNYNIKFNVAYDKGNTKENVYRYSGVFVEGIGSKKSTPKIIVNKYSVNPKIVRAGEEFDLEIEFLNTHGSKNVHNVKAYITVDEESNETGNVFSPVNASNTFYIREIKTNGVIKRKLRMYTIPDAKPRTYELIINIEYEDSEGTQYTGKELIGIPVNQSTKIETSDINIDGKKFVDKETYIATNVLNTGRTNVRNLKITLEGNFEKTDTSEFTGSFEAGKSKYFEQAIIPKKAELIKGEVVITYEDIGGTKEEIRKPFEFNATIEVKEAVNMENEGKANKEDLKADKKKFGIIPIGIGVGVVVIIVFIIIRKKHKKKKENEMMLGE